MSQNVVGFYTKPPCNKNTRCYKAALAIKKAGSTDLETRKKVAARGGFTMLEIRSAIHNMETGYYQL